MHAIEEANTADFGVTEADRVSADSTDRQPGDNESAAFAAQELATGPSVDPVDMDHSAEADTPQVRQQAAELQADRDADVSVTVGALVANQAVAARLEHVLEGGDGDDIHPPNNGDRNGDTGDHERRGELRMDGKPWPHGGERPEPTEAPANRLQASTSLLLRTSEEKTRGGYQMVSGKFNQSLHYYTLYGASRATNITQRAEAADGGTWEGSYNATRIDVETRIKTDEPPVARTYYVFRPDQLADGEEDFRQQIARSRPKLALPAEWPDDPVAWPVDGAVILQSLPDNPDGIDFRVIEDISEDPLLLKLVETLDGEQVFTAFKDTYEAADAELSTQTEEVQDRPATGNSRRTFTEVVLKPDADVDAVRRNLESMYQHRLFMLRIPLQGDEDPVTTIELAQQRAADEIRRTLGDGVSQEIDPSLESFAQKLGLTTNTELIFINEPSSPTGHYASWPEYIAENFANNTVAGSCYPDINAAFVVQDRYGTPTARARIVMHEIYGHGTQKDAFNYLRIDNELYVWPKELRKFEAMKEARAEIIAANYLYISLQEGGKTICTDARPMRKTTEDIAERTPIAVTDKYMLEDHTRPGAYSVVATVWELLLAKDPSLFEPFLACDDETVKQKVDALVPGLYDRMKSLRNADDISGVKSTLFYDALSLHDAVSPTEIDRDEIHRAVARAHYAVEDAFRHRLQSAETT